MKCQLIENAKRHFGLTDDCREAGFLLDTGEMLDFSGDKQEDARFINHAAISNVFPNEMQRQMIPEQITAAFMKITNAVRFGTIDKQEVARNAELFVLFELENEPTEAQWKQLLTCCQRHGANVAYDIYKGTERAASDYLEKPCVDAIAEVRRKFESLKSRN